MSQRLFRLLWVLVLTALLAACAKPEETKATYKGTLVLHGVTSLPGYPAPEKPSAGWYQERAREFERLRPGITVDLRVHPSQGDLEAAVMATGGDLAFGRLVGAGGVPIAPFLEASVIDDLIPGMAEGFRPGLPVLANLPVLALNTNAFAAGGIPLPTDGAWSRERFEAVLAQFTAGQQYGLGFYFLPGSRDWYPLTGEDSLAGLARLQEYRSAGWLHPDTAKLGPEQTWRHFAQKPAAFAVMPIATWAIPLLRDAPYHVSLAVAGFPDGYTTGSLYGFTLLTGSADPLRQQAAADLAALMAAPDQQVRLARETGLLPARKSAGNPFEGDPDLTSAYRTAAGFRPFPWEQGSPEFERNLHLVLLGAKSPRDALQSATTPAARQAVR